MASAKDMSENTIKLYQLNTETMNTETMNNTNASAIHNTTGFGMGTKLSIHALKPTHE